MSISKRGCLEQQVLLRTRETAGKCGLTQEEKSSLGLLLTPGWGVSTEGLLSLFFLMFISWEKESIHKQGKGKERGVQRIPSRLCADSREPNEGLELTNHEIMTWAEVRCLTNWGTPTSKLLKGRVWTRVAVLYFCPLQKEGQKPCLTFQCLTGIVCCACSRLFSWSPLYS